MEPDLHFYQSRILSVPVKLHIINLDTKIFHLNQQIIHCLQDFQVELSYTRKEVVHH